MPRVVAFMVAILGLLVGPGFAAEPPAATPPPALTPEQKSSLEMLDRFLARFDLLLAKVDDPRVRTDTQAVLDGLKVRRRALDEKFDQGRYEELRLDVNTESQRVAIWLAPLKTLPARSPAK